MEEWVHRALQRWPNVPALYGWLRLDRRGRWLIKGEVITRPQIIDVINRNYDADEYGRWYFQNGPQRGYMQLESAPFILHVDPATGRLQTHTGLVVNELSNAYLDEEGALTFATEHGPGALIDSDLEWALANVSAAGAPITEVQLEQALSLPSDELTSIRFRYGADDLPVIRLDKAHTSERLNFVRNPAPRLGEHAVIGGVEE